MNSPFASCDPPRRTRWRPWVAGMALLFGLPAGLATVLSLLAFTHWRFDLLTHFRAQYAGALLLGVLGLLTARLRGMAAVMAVPLTVNVLFILPLYLPVDRGVPPEAPSITLVHFNVNSDNANKAAVCRWIDQCAADLVVVQEVTAAWSAALDAESPGYERVVTAAREDNFGIALLRHRASSRVRIERAGIVYPVVGMEAGDVPAIEVELTCDGRAMSLLAVHPLPPVSKHYSRRRNETLRTAAAWAVRHEAPVVVMGDLNASPWSVIFRRVLREGELINSQHGFGLQPTWPAVGGPAMLLGIPIDHCLHSRKLVTLDRRVGPSLGSDHRAVWVRLAWREKADR